MSYEELKEKYELLERENLELKKELRIRKEKTVWDRIQQIKYNWLSENFVGIPKFSKDRMLRKLTDDIKWDLHVRETKDFKEEHIEQVKEYLKTYKFEKYEEEYRRKEVI